MNKLFGNAVVGQSGGPTAAINATLAGVIEGALGTDIIGTLYGMRNGIEGLLEDRLVDLGEIFKDSDKLETLKRTPAAALGSCRKKLPSPHSEAEADKAFYEKLISVLKKHDIRYFFYIGGNDSMDTVAKLSEYVRLHPEYELRVIGIPKTIDNDLAATDHAPGYGSAAKFIATVMQEIVQDCAVYTVRAVTIVEIMGRDAGWLTAAAGVGGLTPDCIYFPERDFTMEQFYSDVEKALEKHPNVVIAVSEGIRFPDGHYVGEAPAYNGKDAFGHVRLSGAAKNLEFAVKEKFGCKVRSIELNLPQRCGAHILSLTDVTEAGQIGRQAVETALSGASGEMMIFERVSRAPYECRVTHKAVSDIANAVSNLPDEYINAEGNGITDACIEYILPLISGEVDLKYKNGTPEYIVI